MSFNSLKSQAFVLKGRLYTLTVLQLMVSDISLLAEHLDATIAKAPRMFDNIPIILDCSALSNAEFDLQACCQMMHERHILPIAIQGANAMLSSIAQCLGLGVLHASSHVDKPIHLEEEAPKQAADSKAKLQTHPVRSGQQVVARGGDLIVAAAVSHGAELMADGNIHVYGTLRGRALAGMSGNKAARIFCLSLEAELLSIAGFYRLTEAINVPKGPCQIYLKDEQIHIETLC